MNRLALIRPVAMCIVLGGFFAPVALAQMHFTDCAFGTGSNATLVLPEDATYELGAVRLSAGDEIAVYTNEGLCTGVATWTGAALGLTIWGDNEMTPEVDGHPAGAPLHIRFFDADSETTLPAANQMVELELADDQPYHHSNNAFRNDAIYVVASLRLTDARGDADDPKQSIALRSEAPLNADPVRFSLHQNFPNPFNGSTTFSFAVERTAWVTLAVFDALGREVAVPHDGMVPPGVHEVTWDAADLTTGRYICRMEVAGAAQARVLSFIK